MTSIEQLIGDLLLQNNCVIVPSFGGFVAQQVSAKIDFESGRMLPPSKSLLFNKQLINNDGLLVNELAKQNILSFDSASAEINSKVSEWNTILNTGGRIELDRIGFLYYDAENNLCFEQDRFFNLLLESFGLQQIRFLTEEDVRLNEQRILIEENSPSIIPITSENIMVVDESTETKVVEHPVLKKSKTKIWKYVAAACILPIAFYSFWIPMNTSVLESGIISFRDFNPFHKYSEIKYQPTSQNSRLSRPKELERSFNEAIEDLPENIEIYTYKFDEALFIPVKIKEAPSKDETEITPANLSFNANEMFYIVGCFGKEKNANKLVAKLITAGLDAQIVDVKNGLHRVAAGSAISQEALNKIKDLSINLGFKGWTLK